MYRADQAQQEKEKVCTELIRRSRRRKGFVRRCTGKTEKGKGLKKDVHAKKVKVCLIKFVIIADRAGIVGHPLACLNKC